MALVNSAFTVNVTPGAMPPIVNVSEYDIGRTYTVTINGQDGSAFNIPTGTTATVEGTLNGSVGFTQSATISNNQVSFALSESMTAYSGKAWCKIKLTLNDEPIQTCAFILDVDRAGVEAETVIGAPGFEEQIQNAVDAWLDEHGASGGGGLTDEAKQALLNVVAHIGAWSDGQGRSYYDALYAALYPSVDVLSISAVFTQGSAVIYTDDSLDTLKQYLVVTATMTDSTTQTVTNYTLSGTLTEGTSTITVSYGGKTTTFNVTVTAIPVPSTYQRVEWVGSTGTSHLDGGPFILTNISETGMAQLNGYKIRMTVACGTPINGGSGTTSGMFVGFSSKAGTYVSSLASGGIGIGTAASGLLPNVVCTDTNDYVLEFSSTGLTLSSGTNSVTRNYSTSGDTAQQLRIGTSFVDANTASWLKYFDHIKVEKNGNLVGDFYPCYRKSDNVIGFYDIITETFFVNSGTGGTFTKGADIQ